MSDKPIVPAYVPRVHAVRHTLRAGDTLEGIAEAYGLSGCAYGEIVGANMELGLTAEHVAPGQPYKLAGLRAGQLLKLPASWPVPVVTVGVGAGGSGGGGKGSSGSGGSVNPGEDNKLDAVGLAIAEQLHALTGPNDKGIAIADTDLKAYFNAVSQWYRSDVASGTAPAPAAPPTWNDLRPYVLVARDWLKLYGAQMRPADREQLAWTLFRWRVGLPDLQLLAQRQPLDWARVRDWANKHIKPGVVKTKPEPKVVAYKDLWKAQDFAKDPWSAVPWSLPFSEIPAWAMPWGYLTAPHLQALTLASKATAAQRADALIADLAVALGLPPEEAAPVEKFKTAPGGRPPPIYQARGKGRMKRPPTDKDTTATKETPWGLYALGGGVVIVLGVGGWMILQPGKTRK